MAGEFEPPPTFALPVEVNERGEQQFSPHWISWFYKLVNWLNLGGGVTPGTITVEQIQVFSSRGYVTKTDLKKLRNSGQMILANRVFGD